MRARAAPPPAKLSPPRLLRALPRERLFAWLDEQREGAGIWIGGPPGAGKSTLVASYLIARKLTAIWYRLDQEDNDAGHFFSLIAQSGAARAAAARLPRFSPEHLVSLDSYARSFFRALFARLPRPAALVLDNAEQAPLPSLPAIIAVALNEAPAGITLFVTSRLDPLTVLARPGLSGSLAVLPPSALAFSDEEARAYAQTAKIDEDAMAGAARRVGGWAAGLALLSHDLEIHSGETNRDKLFTYFAAGIYGGLTADCQRVVAISSLLPFVPADIAGEISGIAGAGGHLERLREANLFTERLDQAATIYRFHPLFREFLQNQAERQFSAPQIAAFRHNAARAFAQRHDTDSALDLYLDAGEYRDAAAILTAVLEDKLAAGRVDQLAAWFSRFTDAALEGEPRLLYGWGRACFLREDARALTYYERADRRFAQMRGLYWRQLCAAGALEWNYNTDSFIGHQRWCDILLTPLAVEHAALTQQHALRIYNGRLLACFFAGNFPAEASAWVNEILRLLSLGGAESEKLSSAITLLGCLERHKRWDEATLLTERMESLLASSNCGPRLAILVRQQIASDFYRQTGAYDEVRRRAGTTRADACKHGFSVLEYEGVAILLIAALCTGDEAETSALLADLARLTDSANVYHQRFMHQMRAWHALQQNHVTAAREHAEALRTAVHMSDMPPRFRATWLIVCPYVAFAEGNEATALAELAGFIADAEPGSRQTLESNFVALQAWQHLKSGDENSARAALEKAFAMAAGIRYYQLIAPLRSTLAALAGFALDHGIAPTFAQELIYRRRLAPPADASDAWPWPVRIHTLGGFELLRENARIRFAGKAQHKPLTLLKATIAFGGEAVDTQTIMELLWPDADGDDAKSAFGVALFRLRKLLGHDEALLLQDGKLSINAAICRLDVRALEQLFDRIDSALHDDAPDPPIAALAESLLKIYKGHFLANESESWMLAPRERLRSRFLRHASAIGKRLESTGQWSEAAEIYERVLELDGLAEEFYRGLMICHRECGRRAEAMVVYRRCREMLSIVLGVPPSAETQAVFETLNRVP